MIEFPYEKEAKRGLPAPDYIQSYALHTYHALAALYHRFKLNSITPEEGHTEKQKILRQYDLDKKDADFMDKLAAHHVKVIRATEKARNEYRLNRTLENADKLVAAIDGLNVIDIINPVEEMVVQDG